MGEGILLVEREIHMSVRNEEALARMFEQFGRAAFAAQFLEEKLLQRNIIISADSFQMDSEKIGQLEIQLRRKTLGLLIPEWSKKESLHESVISFFHKIKESRNFLIHHFFVHYAKQNSSTERYEKETQVLRKMTADFELASALIDGLDVEF